MSKNTFKTTILLAALGGFFVLVGSVVGGRGGATIGLVMAFLMVGGSYWFSDTIAIKSAGAVPVTEQQMPEYYAIVRELTERAGLPMPKLYVTPDLQPNAFATGRNPKHAAVAVTRGILEVLDWEELRGVLAHEISHVGNRDILISSIAAAVATAISYVANMAMWRMLWGGGDDEDANPVAMLLGILVAPLAATFLHAGISRSREFEADRTGAALIGNGEPLARALAKLEHAARVVPMDVSPAQASLFIVNPLTGRRVQFADLMRTHPPTEQRIARLREGDWQREVRSGRIFR